MINKAIVLLLPFSLTFTSFGNIKTSDLKFDKEVLEKTESFIKQKKTFRKIRSLVYPGWYPEKEVISAQQYLQKKQEKLLKEYEETRSSAQDLQKKSTIVVFLGGLCTAASIKYDFFEGMVVSALFCGCGVIGGIASALYLGDHPESATDTQKNKALGIILDEKIDTVKAKISYGKALYYQMRKSELKD